MNLKSFFEHWYIRDNPFQAEEARNDEVYLRNLAEAMTHPDFEKVYGSPREVSTSVVFGKKGSGKTAMRLLMEERYRSHNKENPNDKVWVIRYDDLNPMLDRIAQNENPKRPEKSVDKVRLVDHQDAILSLGVTELVDKVLGDHGDESKSQKETRQLFRKMPRNRRLDLALLTALYDQPSHGHGSPRLARLRRLTRVTPFWQPKKFLALAGLSLIGLVIGAGYHWLRPEEATGWLIGIPSALLLIASLGVFLVGFFKRWSYASRLHGELRTHARQSGEWRTLLGNFAGRDLSLAPLPRSDDQESRYEWAQRFNKLIQDWGYQKIVVLVDRVDEPQFVNSDPSKMRNLVWPMLNNKFLQQDAFALKLLLPAELGSILNREDSEFFRQARLDKQNLIGRLEWTGATLYDVCTRRLKSCQDSRGEKITGLADLFEENVSAADLINALDQMKQPRDAFKFLYQVIQEHCLGHPDDEPVYKIPRVVLDMTRKRQSQRLDDLNLGLSPG